MQILSKTKTTWHGALNWLYKAMEKNGAISGMSKNNMLSTEPSGLPGHPSIEHGLVLTILEMTPNFARRRAAHGTHPSQD
jgi:hypothetical protein